MKNSYKFKSNDEVLKLFEEIAKIKTNTIVESGDIEALCVDMITFTEEEARFFYLDTGNRIIKIEKIQGTVNSAAVSVRSIAKEALLLDAKSVIMVHNHPGGRLKFSESDVNITAKLKAGLKTLEIGLLDHILISDKGSKSMQSSKDWGWE
jgi:DNA repair protein RadC